MTPSVDKLLFIATSAFTSAADRRAFLEFACQGDKELRDMIEELLEIDRDAEEFFEFPPEVENPEAPPAEDGGGEGGIGARIGPYRLIDRLGSGGCGVVYLAEQQEPVKRKVALKIIRLGMDTESVIARFAMEREALALMDHPNIARVLDAGTTAGGRPYFAMELVDGEKITDFCDRQRLDLRERLELFISVCEAIQHAHQKGVIHRDIKPSNVLVREHDGRTVPKVIDFGIAKATGAGLDAEATVTRSGQLIGTPAYMSPEQADGRGDVDTRSDIYSLGALLCELLTGRPPFDHEQFRDRGVEEIRTILRDEETGMPSKRLRVVTDEEIGRIAEKRGADPQRLPSLLAGDLDWIVMKAVEKDRQGRYETANGLAMDVRRYLKEEPVLARPPSRGYLLKKLIRRNRVTFAAGSVAVFGLLAGFSVSTWLFFREKAAREEQARLHHEAEIARHNTEEARARAEKARASEARLSEDAKVAESVAEAAVKLGHRQLEEADKLLQGLPAERTPRSLEAANTFKELANWNLAKGSWLDQAPWKTGAARLNALGYVLTSVDNKSEREGISFDMLSVMTGLSLWGEEGQYENMRGLMIERFGNSENPIVAEHVLKATLLEPADEKILGDLQRLAGVLGESLDHPHKDASAHMTAWRQFSMALMAYREERFAIATERAQGSLALEAKSEPKSEPRVVSNQLILAMVDLKQGRVEKARSALKGLREQVDHWMETPFQVVNPDGRTLWYNQYATLILLREAEKLLGQAGD